jgi:hypothetical protein
MHKGTSHGVYGKRAHVLRQAETDSRQSEKEPRLERSQVLQACVVSSAVIATFGAAGTLTAHMLQLSDSFAVNALVRALSVDAAAIAVAAGLSITASRSALLALWPDLKSSNDTANAQVRPEAADKSNRMAAT